MCPGLGWPPSDCGQLKHTDCCSKCLGFPHLSVHQNHLGGGGLLKYQYRLQGPISRILDSVDLQWDLVVCISNKCPGDPDAAGTGNTLKGS